MGNTSALRLLLAVNLSWLLLGLSSAAAAAAAPTGDTSGVEEVVVTANRSGEQSVQSVPMSIQVVSPAALDEKGLGSIDAFINTLPSVNMQSNSPGVNSLEMRGVVTTAIDITTLQNRSLVAYYLDDAPIGVQAANPDLRVFDLERIELLKGPQGTLYGAGSMSGTVRFITRKPDTHTFQFNADTSLSGTQDGGTNYSIRSTANIPVTDGILAVRLGGYRGQDSGWIDNIGTNVRDANEAGQTQGRVAIRWTPTERLTLDGSVTFARLIAHGDNEYYPALGKFRVTSLTQERFDDYFKLYNLTGEADLGFGRLVASVSYQDRFYDDQRSFDFFDEALMTPGILLPSNGQQINNIKDAPQEVRLISNQDQRLRWIVGAYHEYYHRFYPQILDSPGFDSTIAGLYGIPPTSESTYGTAKPDQPFWGTIDVRERQYALFGELTYAIVPKLDLTVGARYFDFRQNFDLIFAGFAGGIGPGQPLTRTGVQASKGGNPRVVLSYKLEDNLMVYTQATRGFRYGGVNLPVPLQFCANDLSNAGLTDAPATFGPDSLWNYEIGEKGRFLDNKLLFNLTGFYIDWRDVQTTYPLQCGYPFVVNAGRVASRGLELETSFRVTNALTVSLNGSYTNATADGAIQNLSAPDGASVPFFPRLITNLQAQYVTHLGTSGDIRWEAGWTHREGAFTEFNLSDPYTRYIPSSEMVNATISFLHGNWEVALYGTNLTNNLLINSIGANNREVPYQPDDMVYIGRPRTIGIRVHYGF